MSGCIAQLRDAVAGVDFESLIRTPGDQVRLPGLEKRNQGFNCGGAFELLGGVRSLVEDLAADLRRKAEGFTAFVTPGIVGRTAESAMCHEEEQGAPESLGQRLSSLHTGQMAQTVTLK